MVVLTTLTVVGYSQKLTMNQYRLINHKILDLMEDYDKKGTFTQYPSESFLELFVNDSAMVYNDCFPEYDKLNISVKEYCAKYESARYNPHYTIKNISFDNIKKYSSNLYKIELSFEKEIYFLAKEGDNRYPIFSPKLNAVILCNLNDSTLKIEQIICKVPQDQRFSIFSIQKLTNKNLVSLITGLPEKIGSDSVCIIDNDKVWGDIKVTSPYLKLSKIPEEKDNRIIYAKLTELKNSFGINFVFAPSFYGCSLSPTIQADFKSWNNKSKVKEFGLDVMTKIFGGSKSRGMLQTGLYGSFSELQFDGVYAASYSDVDPDGGTYTRLTDITIYEMNTFKHLVIPFLLRYEYFIKNEFVFYGNVGLKNYIPLEQKFDAYGSSFYRGYYPDLWDVTIDQNGIYDFGHYEEKKQEIQNTKTFSTDYVLAAGVGYTYKNRVSIDFGLIYQSSITNINKPMEGYKMSKTHNDYNSMINAMSDFKRKAVGFELKLRYNFNFKKH